jgi:murein endopeptidase
MNRSEFTGSLATAALSASFGKASAGALVGTASELPMLEAQQQFIDLREQRGWGDPKT